MKLPKAISPNIFKASLLLVVLGEKAAKQVMRFLPKNELEKISQCLEMIHEVPQQEAEEIVKECYSKLYRSDEEHSKLNMNSLRATDNPAIHQSEDDILSVLNTVPPQELAEELEQEQPETITAMLLHLDPIRAAALFSRFNPQLQREIATYFDKPQFLANFIANLDKNSKSLVLEVLEQKKPHIIQQMFGIKSTVEPKL